MIEIVRTGRNLTIRQISKTHGVAISWLHELYEDRDVRMRYISTSMMAADIFTKEFTVRATWETLCQQCNIVPSTPSEQGW